MKVSRSQLRRIRSIVSMGIVICCLVVCGSQRGAQAQDPQVDLQGIIPDYVPEGLGEGDFNQLGGNWTDWSAETGRLVTDFYTSENDEVRGRRQTLEEIQSKLNTMNKALSDSRYLPIYGPLADLYGRLSRRIAVAQALLDTVEQDMTRPSPSRVNSVMDRLASDGRSLRSHLNSINGGDRWIDFLSLNEVVTAAGQRDSSEETLALIAAVQQKLEDRAAYNDEQQAFLNREPIHQFQNSLARATQLLNVEDPQQRREQLYDSAATLMQTIEDYEAAPTSEGTQRLRGVFDDIRRLAPDGAAALTAAMRKHYLNYNFRVVVDESLAQDVVRESQVDSGFINEMVSRAHVSGCQWTNATVNMDLKPSNGGMRFDLILDGNVRSSVTGSTHLATVHTSGQFHFHGRKPVTFDGEHFQSWPASVGVGGGNRPYAARTRLSWIPLVGRIAENAALREAGSAENNQYARNKVYQQARSQFDRDANDNLRRAEQTLESDLTRPLREGGYYPGVKRLTSTETQAELRSRLMEVGESGGGDTLPLPIEPAGGVLVQLHESLLNQIGDRLDLEGKRFTPESLEQYLKDEIEKISGEPVDLGGITLSEDEASDSPKVEEIIFHDSDAVRFDITGGEVVLYLNLGLKLEDREEIEPQRISVPLQFTLAGNQIHMERGTVGVSPIGRVEPRDRAEQIVRAGVMRQKIQEAFEPQDFDSSRDLTFENKTLTLQVTDLRAHSGWLSVIATNSGSGPQSPGQPVHSQPLQQVGVSRSP